MKQSEEENDDLSRLSVDQLHNRLTRLTWETQQHVARAKQLMEEAQKRLAEEEEQKALGKQNEVDRIRRRLLG